MLDSLIPGLSDPVTGYSVQTFIRNVCLQRLPTTRISDSRPTEENFLNLCEGLLITFNEYIGLSMSPCVYTLVCVSVRVSCKD